MDQLSGFVDHIIFSSEETGFTVARLKTPHERDHITVVGSLPWVNTGETLHCKGTWKHHPRHGRQFEIESFELTAPVDLLGIQRYLESGMIKGIGSVYAKRIVKEFGVKTLEVIDKTPHRLTEIPGLGTKRVEKIEACWNEQKEIRNVMIFLQTHKVRPSFAQKIFKRYGEESIDKVKGNPYSLAKEIYGIGFKSADELAQNLGITKDSPLRIKAGIEHVLWEMSNGGHVCFPRETFIPEAEKILEVEGTLIKEQITELELEGHIMVEGLEGVPYLWVRPLYRAEWGIAQELNRIKEAPCNIRPVLIDKAIDWAQEKHRIRFAKEQKLAISKSLEEKIHIITGGPGTGKSTITRAIFSITSQITDKITLAAPTGRAAKRMTEITGKKAFTIHSLLEFDFNEGGFKRTRDNPLTARLIIIDEASMIDTLLMYSLLKAIPNETRLTFIGDIDQLPSVGPGNILKDMINSETIPMTRLKFIFRQGKGSRIVANAHRINAGYFPETEHEQGSDFIFFNIESPEELLSKIVNLIECHIPEKFPFHPIDDIQVLSPMKKGVIGTDNLNHVLQQKLNPQPQSLERMGRRFNLYDKVMQIRNNYDKKVYNGDVGRITSLDMENQELIVNFDGKEVSYDFSDIDELMLAYAVSIHKYQGSECPCVIIPVHTSHFKLLFRNLLYTGITRGKKLVILLGTKKALAIAVKTDNVKTRYTGLQCFLKSLHSTTSSPTIQKS
ncbi:MAG: ATP-dependent RecD-like DNA helicase [Candidatus Neptunochlamydia sp.]|nr:ATP-dependent RecD-like DNA helicase [Candidatus Neptunochlamydia sp.]